jgi:3-oxoacyl-[acyl-carrier protein] reductase
MDFGIKDKVALVLASSKGLGRAIAISLAKEGVKVILTGRSVDEMNATAKEITAVGGYAYVLPWDLHQLDQIDAKVSQIEKDVGPIDILINNSGGPPMSQAFNQSIELWQTSFNQMILMIMKVTDRVLPGMRERKWGRVITTTSSGTVSPIANLAISNTLRMALNGWSKTLSNEVAAEGVTVNIILPGRILTDRIMHLDGQRAVKEGKPLEEITQKSVSTIPMKRYGTPSEYADAATFLASQQASYITGTSLRVDGGSFAGL